VDRLPALQRDELGLPGARLDPAHVGVDQAQPGDEQQQQHAEQQRADERRPAGERQANPPAERAEQCQHGHEDERGQPDRPPRGAFDGAHSSPLAFASSISW
jgi:hypothetical protein